MIITDLETPTTKAEVAAALEIRTPTKGGSPLYAYLAAIIKAEIDKKNPGAQTNNKFSSHTNVTISGGVDGYICMITRDDTAKRVALHAPVLKDAIRQVEEYYLGEIKEDRPPLINYDQAVKAVSKLRTQIVGNQTDKLTGIIIARR